MLISFSDQQMSDISTSCNHLMIDLNYITDYVISKFLQNSSISFSSCNQTNSSEDGIDLKAYIYLSFILLILCLVFGATIYDYNSSESETNEDNCNTNLNLMKGQCSSIVSLDSVPSVDNNVDSDEPLVRRVNLFKSIVLAFSAKQNINLILDTNNNHSSNPSNHNQIRNHFNNNNNGKSDNYHNESSNRSRSDDNANNNTISSNIIGDENGINNGNNNNNVNGNINDNVNVNSDNNTNSDMNNGNRYSEKQISSIHGLKVISMFWIIGGHSYSFAMQWLFFQNSQDIEYDSKMIISQIYANTNFSVDCFFFTSGLLVGYAVFKELRRCGRLNYFQFYLHRYIRMTPLMMIIIGFCVTLLKYMGSGPTWVESTTMFDKWCQNNWWINSLYLHNFINRENMCLSHSWYSAVDMQLYFISPLILIPLFWFPFWGILLIVLLLTGSMIITATLTIVNHYPPVPYLTNITSREALDGYYGWIYIKPWCRIGPYLIGISIAYLIYLHNNKPKIKKRFVVMGWFLALLLNAGILLAMFPAINGYPLSDAVAGLYSATSRTLWSIGLAWIVYACVTGHGGIVNSLLSWKPFIPLSRLSYSAYLIHPVIIACFYGSRETTFHFSHYLMVYFILGNIVITYVISFGLAVFFEAPIAALEKLFRQPK